MEDCSKKVFAKLPAYVPSLEELAEVISSGLAENFVDVHVDVIDCPDLRSGPFLMSASSFGGDLRIGEVGGIGNLFPTPQKNKFFDLKEICEACELPNAFVFGPGAGPQHVVGKNCEMVADANFCAPQPRVATKIAKITDDGDSYEMQTIHSAHFSLMANLGISSQRASKVLRIRAEKRKGKKNFSESVRVAVANRYGDLLVSLAGIFVLEKGKARLHVMPGFPNCDFQSQHEVDQWLRFFEMRAPLVCACVIHSKDVEGHKLRLEHTHCFSEHGDAGHYHYDTTPDEVLYTGYFAPANFVYRIDIA